MNVKYPALICTLCLAGTFFLASCATIPHLSLVYSLPQEGKAPSGKQVYVLVKDLRTDKRILGMGARKAFPEASEDIALFLAKGKGEGVRQGIYTPSDLLKEAFESRLRQKGIEVASDKSSPIGVSLSLKSFLLDRVDRKWLAKMTCGVELLKEDRVVYSETLSGDAERYELVGKEQAEVILGEIFSEVLNRLDVDKMFEKTM